MLLSNSCTYFLQFSAQFQVKRKTEYIKISCILNGLSNDVGYYLFLHLILLPPDPSLQMVMQHVLEIFLRTGQFITTRKLTVTAEVEKVGSLTFMDLIDPKMRN